MGMQVGSGSNPAGPVLINMDEAFTWDRKTDALQTGL